MGVPRRTGSGAASTRNGPEKGLPIYLYHFLYVTFLQCLF